MRTDRTNRIARGRGEVTSGNVESAEIWFEGDTDCGAGEGTEPWLQRRASSAEAQAQAEHLPKAVGWGQGEGLNFVGFYNQRGFKTGVPEVPLLGYDRDLRTLSHFGSCSRQTALVLTL